MKDLFANATLALMHQGGDALVTAIAIAIAYLYDTLGAGDYSISN